MINNNPIGILDSGTGGLSVYLSVRKKLPKESYIYIGDHAYNPYGNKSKKTIISRVKKLILFLLSQKVKCIVVACNTATVAGIDEFRSINPDVPIIGVVPVIKTAAALSKKKHFVVLSTNYTATSQYQGELIARYAPECRVESVGSSSLVPLMESGHIHDEVIRNELKKIFADLGPMDYDVIALGCTHYPFLRPSIRAIVGNTVTILDSGDVVARQVSNILDIKHIKTNAASLDQRFFTTGNADTVTALFKQLVSKNICVTHVKL